MTRASLAGLGELVRLAFRRDRIMLPVWIYALTAIAASGGYGLKQIYKTPANRASLATSVLHDPALSFLYGQLHGSSLGALVSWRYLTYAALAAGLMSIFVVVRHTRADEETGRLELIGSAVVGRNAPLAVALVLAGVANLILVVLVTAGLSVSGLPLVGALAFALAMAGCGLVFAALAAVAAQISGTARGARGIAIAVLAVSFLLRGIGDSSYRHGGSWVTWLSPIGWAEVVRPFAAERWWVLLISAAATVAGVTIAFALAARRDHGAGLVQPRPGPGEASRWLGGPAGLAWRQQRGAMAAWTAGFVVFGIAVGIVAKGIGELLGSSKAVENAITKIGGQGALTNAYIAAIMGLFGLIAAAFAISAVLRLKSEEAAGLAEPILASPVGRTRWAASHLLIVTAGTAIVLLAAGFGTGIGYGVAISDVSGQLPRVIGAALVQLPAALAIAAVAAAIFGMVPQWSSAVGWSVLAVCGVIEIFGPSLKLSHWLLDVSPLTHVPKLPGGVLTATPLVWLSLVALALAAAGLLGLRRRDIG